MAEAAAATIVTPVSTATPLPSNEPAPAVAGPPLSPPEKVAAAPGDAAAAPAAEVKVEGDAPSSLLGESVKAPYNADGLKLPEGLTFADDAKGEFGQWAAKHGISQDAAQEVLDWGSSFVKKGQEAAASSQLQAWKDTNATWVKEVQADPEIGGDKLNNVVRPAVSKLLDNFGPEQGAAIRKMLDYTGTGNHPAMIRLLYGLSKQLTEGGPVAGSVAAVTKETRTPAQIAYPNFNQTRQ